MRKARLIGTSLVPTRTPIARQTQENTMSVVSIYAAIDEHTAKAAGASSGRSAHTLYGGHEHSLRQTLIALTIGTSLAEHQNPGEATVHVLRGRVRLASGDQAWEGNTGDLIKVPDAPHSLEALEDSVVLLTVAK
jgi:quercetin dioxygenase-like cupin family protein